MSGNGASARKGNLKAASDSPSPPGSPDSAAHDERLSPSLMFRLVTGRPRREIVANDAVR